MKHPWTALIGPLCFATALSAQDDPPAENHLWLELESRVFLYNLEGSDYVTRNARTFFGDIGELTLGYRFGDEAHVRAGVVFLLPFSEDDFQIRWGDYNRDFRLGDHSQEKVQLIQPYLQLLYRSDHFTFVFGDLETPHDFHTIVVYDVYEFLRPTEKGMQLLFDHPHLFVDVFINWRELNTPGHHERFNVGAIGRVQWEGGSLSMQTLYVHRGGHEFPQAPQVFENISAAFVFDQSFPIDVAFIDRIGFEAASLYTSDLPVGGNNTDGWGVLGSVYAASGDWTLKFGAWKGEDAVFAEEGFPLTRNERMFFGELTFRKELKHHFRFLFSLTGGFHGRKLRETFFDQKIVISWGRDFALGL